MRLVSLAGKSFVFKFDYNTQLIAEIKKIPSARWDIDSKTWKVSTKHMAQVKDFISKHAFIKDFSFDDVTAARKAVNSAEYIKKLKANSIFNVLREYQKIGAEFLLNTQRALLADEAGNGKSLQVIAASYPTGLIPCLIITKAVLKLTMQHEIAKWFPEASSHVISGRKQYPLPQADFYLINYDILASWVDAIKKLKVKTLVFDESHYIKEASSQRGKAALQIAKSKDFIFLLTGTPILNRPKDLIHQLNVLGRLDDFGGKWGFAARYCNMHKTAFGMDISGASNTKELNERLSSFMLRRRKKDVLKDLPDRQLTDVYLELSNRDEYDFAHKETVEWLKDKTRDYKQFLKSIEHLSPLKRAQAKWMRAQLHQNDTLIGEQLVRIEKLKQLSAEGKVKAAVKWVENFLESDEKLILFCTHKNIQDSLLKAFPKAVTIYGRDSLEKRDKSVQEFQNNPAVNLIICSIDSAAEGLTLTAASNVAFLEFPWTAAKVDQAISRAHRLGQLDKVTGYFLLAENSIDIDIYNLIKEKSNIAAQIVDGEDVGELSMSIINDLMVQLSDK